MQRLRDTVVGGGILGGALVALMLGPIGILLFAVSAIFATRRFQKRSARDAARALAAER